MRVNCCSRQSCGEWCRHGCEDRGCNGDRQCDWSSQLRDQGIFIDGLLEGTVVAYIEGYPLVATTGALDLLGRNWINATTYLTRHQCGDFGTLCPADVQENVCSRSPAYNIVVIRSWRRTSLAHHGSRQVLDDTAAAIGVLNMNISPPEGKTVQSAPDSSASSFYNLLLLMLHLSVTSMAEVDYAAANRPCWCKSQMPPALRF